MTNGKGFYIYADGREYTGQFENFKKWTWNFILSNGLKYVGEFKDGNREGYTMFDIKGITFT